jgi:hypothetical protein
MKELSPEVFKKGCTKLPAYKELIITFFWHLMKDLQQSFPNNRVIPTKESMKEKEAALFIYFLLIIFVIILY